MDKRYSILTIAEALGADPITLKRQCYEAHILYGKGLTIEEIEKVLNRVETRNFKTSINPVDVGEIRAHFNKEV